MKSLPVAKKIDHTYQIHGQNIKDEYAWLRDKNWPSTNLADPEIEKYLNQENEYFDRYFSQHEKQVEKIFDELKSRIKLADISAPVKRDEYFYYVKTIEQGDYKIYCRKKDSLTAKEEILLDVNLLAQDKKYTKLGSFSVSPDHKMIAYSIDHKGDEKYTIKILDIAGGQYLDSEISGVSGGVIWHQNNQQIFFSKLNEHSRNDTVYVKDIFTKAPEQLLHKETNNLYQLHISKSSSKEYLFIGSDGHEDNEVYAISLQDKDLKPFLLRKRSKKTFFHIDHAGQDFFIHTNFSINPGSADNFYIGKISSNLDSSKIADADMDECIKHHDSKYLVGFDVTKNYLLLSYSDQKRFIPEVKIIKLPAGETKNIDFPDSAFSASAHSTNFEEDDIRVEYTSQIRPFVTYNYDFESSKLTILKEQEIPSGFDSAEYNTERVFAPSRENPKIQVPITLVYKKSLFKKNGKNPLYLYGYGSYGHGISPYFSSLAISMVNRGFVFAIAHIRGGDELGKNWHEQAKFLNKKRTFNDFVDCAKYLTASGYAEPGNITISGGSAGGLLIGAAINDSPGLFRAAVAHVPFVDVLSTMLDESLPLTPGEFKEWGNPKDKEYFEYMKSYSPYDNIKNQQYPHVMVTTALGDIRVGYWEAAKWVARLRRKKTDDNIIIMKTNMSQGHSGASGRFDYLKEVAKEIVFVLSHQDQL